MKKNILHRFSALFLSMILIVTSVLTLSGCDKNKPEEAVSRYFTAMFKTFDAQEFIDVMSPHRFEAQMKSAGVKEDQYKDNVKVMMDGVKSQIKTQKMGIKWQIKNAEYLEKDTYAELKSYYKDTFDVKIKDAKLVKAKITKTISGLSEEIDYEFVVVKLDNKWYVDTAQSKHD